MRRSERVDPAVGAATWRRDEETPPRRLAPGALAAAAGFVALWPFTSVIEPGAWSFAVTAVVFVTALTGIGMRTLLQRRPEWVRELVPLFAQIVAAIGTVTLLVAGDTAVFGVVPTPSTWSVFGSLAAGAWEEIAYGSAPLNATPGLELVLAGGFAVLAILLDQLVAHQNALLAGLLAAVVGALPMIVTVSGANVVWFVMLGVLMLVLFGYTARQDPDAPARSAPAITAGIGVIALTATIMIAPGLPVSASWAGSGVGITVNASLNLGDDLRRPTPVEVLTVAAEGEVAPYLRLATLSQFDGRVWNPDESELQEQSDGFGEPDWTEEIESESRRTSIRILRMSSAWLPVPYAATRIQGAPSSWMVMPGNRTVVSDRGDAVGNDYTVTSVSVTPTLEQIQAASAAPPLETEETPVELPASIGDLAAEVTAGAGSDYDRLIALQTWFRSTFSYSLETPVEEEFDGTGADAVARFLEVRSGYCIHFAGAFALMAEELGMQVRIVVGYLPGLLTDQERGEESVFSVTSDQLHSWPEVYFEGIGWVPFEPTASLGVPTRFEPATTTGTGTGGPASPAPTTSPGATATNGPELERNDAGDNAGATGPLRQLDPTPIVLGVVAIVLILLLPALIRRTRRAIRRRRARDGDAMAAWSELRDTLLDLRVAVSDADTPRVRGAALVRERGADPDAVKRLTDAVEQTSYARGGAEVGDLSVPLTTILGDLQRSVDHRTRLTAVMIPRSLFAGRSADAPLLA
ncbi:DUF3488 and transglutaminase-like domain-containing protein [Microbacterium sp. LWH12-1.2]|uniref:transglutaminase family protein n=1 Tax=Microbacterium sp. LWH12-1.2 TaxID=3135259 RepID=UPI00342740C6